MSSEFSPPDGDIVLRTQGSPTRDFRVHKLVLSLASPVFRDMFSIPQPTPTSGTSRTEVEIIDVMDPPQALEFVLRLIYPMPPPNVDNLDLLVEALVITDKYNIECARAKLRLRLTKFIKESPLRVYAVASRFGFDEEAEAASSLTTEIVYLPGIIDLPHDLKSIPVQAYHELVKLHENHRDEIEDIVDRVLFEPACPECRVAKALAEARMRTKLVRLICRHEPMSAAAYIEELGTSCKGVCMSRFIEAVAVKLGGKSTIRNPTF